MNAYYQDKWVTIYHGDCREILPRLDVIPDMLSTDPVWPNASADLPGRDNPTKLISGMFQVLPPVKRIALHLGVDSDPRFLTTVPTQYEFFRVCWLRYIRAHYKGRLLYNSDIAYLFGTPPAPCDGQFLIPGYTEDTSSDGKQSAHPCPRKLWHVKWLVKWWSSPKELILDPFVGSGTTCVAAKELNRYSIGIEIEEKYCEIAAKRCCQEVMELA